MPLRTRTERLPARPLLAVTLILLLLLLLGTALGALWVAPGPIRVAGWTFTGPAVEAQDREEEAALGTFRSSVPVERSWSGRLLFRVGPFRLYRR
jgi:hypothetical protein